uniref:hydroxyacylglutathione hydrolase-like protein isoform X2 n=1 Tax=Callithrix jacchus TaxID=9483 RepID=UPI00159DFFDC|nr:hydroxyacylglutathione hydrolase-like protein isoform X2 [Callithrix jacchus]
MKVKVIPVLEDNYMYLVIEELTREAVAVDVAVPKRLLEIVGREGVSLTAVLTTHHHWDHARGNPELARLRPGLAVLGADERIFSLTRRLAHGEELRVSARPREGGVGTPGPPALMGPPAPPPQFGAIHVRCLLTPGHTSGHMSYFLWEDDCPDPPALFSGTRSAERAHPASRRPRPLCSDPPSPARGRAVGGRLRLVPGGQRPADVPEPGRAEHPAPRDEGVLRPRAHAQQPGVCAESGALQRPQEGRGRCAHSALDSGRGAPLQPLPAGGRGAGAQVHGQGGPRRRPGGALRGAGTLRTGRRAEAATGTGPPCAAVGAPECSPQQVSPPQTLTGLGLTCLFMTSASWTHARATSGSF